MRVPLLLACYFLSLISPASAEEGKTVETTLLVKVIPRGAEVMVNGTYMGNAPFLIKKPQPGTVHIHARSVGYRSLTRNFDIVANQNNVAVLILASRLSTLGTVSGTLVIDTDPQGATLALDGQPLGKSPMRAENIAEGSYKLNVQFPGLGEKNVPLQVFGGETTQTAISWSEPMPRKFLLELTPREARVHFLNYPQAYQPGMPLPKGRYMLRAYLPGYVTTDIAVEMGDKDFHSYVTLQRSAISESGAATSEKVDNRQ
ncbi:MAG: PEGA domain-containing protein [Magnetococcales bacterium]|nr:PEGA domain-containing protein [Magnetococcales bacterium]